MIKAQNPHTSVGGPKREDILFCRGSLVNRHFGNVKLCALVRERAVEYLTSNYTDAKNTIVRQMIEELSEEGGRFLQATDRGRWEESNQEATVRRIQAVFDEYTSTHLQKDRHHGQRATPSPSSPSSIDVLRRPPAKTVTPPELSPRNTPLRRRETLPIPQSREFRLPYAGSAARQIPQDPRQGRKRSIEIAQLVLLQKQQERRRLLHALGKTTLTGMSAVPPSLRTTAQGKRRQIDPLAPHRKRKTPRPTDHPGPLGR